MNEPSNKYELIINNYINSLDINATLETGKVNYKDILELLDRCYYIGTWITTLFVNGKYKSEWLNGFYVLFNRHLKALLAISSCLQYGCPVEAGLILRSLFENLLNFLVCIEKDYEYRFQLYYEFFYVFRWLRIEEAIKKKENVQITEEQKEKYYQSYIQVKNNYYHPDPAFWGWKVIAPNPKKNYNPTVRDLSIKFALTDLYDSLYRIESEISHANPIAVNFIRQGNLISVNPIYNRNTTCTAAAAIILTEDYFNFMPTILSIEIDESFCEYVQHEILKKASVLYSKK